MCFIYMSGCGLCQHQTMTDLSINWQLHSSCCQFKTRSFIIDKIYWFWEYIFKINFTKN